MHVLRSWFRPTKGFCKGVAKLSNEGVNQQDCHNETVIIGSQVYLEWKELDSVWNCPFKYFKLLNHLSLDTY